MEFNRVGLILTEHCNAKCEMCCSGCEDQSTKLVTYSRDDLNSVLSQIRECMEITGIGITGGEPMLYPELVQLILDFDFGRKMDFSIKTNGFWGASPQKARAFLEKNKGAIERLSFSYDQFHKGYVSLDSIKALIDIARELNIATDVVGCFLADGMQPGDAMNDLGEYAYKTKFEYQPVVNTGLAKNIDNSRFVHLYNTRCDPLLCAAGKKSTILINAAMEVFPCCSQVAENTILGLGNLGTSKLSSIIGSMKHNKILFTLFTKGLNPFVKTLDKNGIEYPQQLSSPCEMCGYLFSDDRLLPMLRVAYDNGDL